MKKNKSSHSKLLTFEIVSSPDFPDNNIFYYGRKPAELRFIDKVEITPGCWFWTGAKNQYGYGRFLENHKGYQAHRWSYQYFIGPIPDGHDVCHTCDEPSCVNPKHLWAGLTRENIWDMCLKGRHRSMPNAPHKHKSKITGPSETGLISDYLKHHPLSKRSKKAS